MVGGTIAHYQVLEKLGAGAMGEVYRARDTRLGRDVAIKALPAAVTVGPERPAAVRRPAEALPARPARCAPEATRLASLNPPNIAPIHGLEESSGALALVMELVGGESLAAR